MHQGRDLLALAIVHGPDPAKLQILHIPGGDLLERRMAPALIIPIMHQPVGRGRMQHHLFGDGRVFGHRAFDGYAGPERNIAAAQFGIGAERTTGGGCGIRAIRTGRSSTPAGARLRGLLRRFAGREGVDRHCRCRR